MLKKGLCILLTVILLFSLCGCSKLMIFAMMSAAGDDRASKEDICEFVRENETELMNAINQRDYFEFENERIIKDIKVNPGVVEFYCGGVGMGSATAYVGFYYSPNDDMAVLWCAPQDAELLSPSGDGYEWHEGDNTYYTEHICGNFYYYSATF